MSLANDKRRKWQGGKWITPLRRLAIYVRDGLACVYCGASVEDEDIRLSVDHLIAEVRGGDNSNTNIATCCSRCNSAKGSRTVAAFCRAVAEYLDNGIAAKQIERHVRACAKRDMVKPTEQARELIAARHKTVSSDILPPYSLKDAECTQRFLDRARSQLLKGVS